MKLYLLRHGQAARTSHDEPRSLTAHGKAEVGRVGEHFKKHKLTVGTVWHSPKTRAVETTRIFLEASGNSDAVCEETQGLKPEADVEGMLRDLEDFKGTSLLLVTHLPFVAELAHALLDGQANGDHAFPTAGMTAFERKAGKWKKLWSLDPSTLK